MAFYEMLPGAGMPPGLQAGMDSVLNKKFGTSTTYPAEDWPDTVNLMGPLPEKTVSGAIVTFSDGADAVPLTKCEVTLPASLDGYSSVDVVSAGKNLVDDSQRYKSGSNIYFGGATTNTELSLVLPAGTYTMTLKNAISVNVNLYLKDIDTNTNVTGFPSYNTATTEPRSKTFTLSKTTRLCAWTYNPDYTGVNDIDFCQIEAGSTVTTYEPYTAPTTHTAQLGRTIYGGSVDVVKGEGSTKVYKHTFTGDNLTSVSLNYGTTEEGYTHMYFYTGGIPLAYNPSGSNVISDIGIPWNNNASSSPYPSSECYRILNTGSGENQRPTVYAYIHQTWASVADFKTWLNANPITVVYEVSDETTFTFDPVSIDSKLGNNTIWSEQGDTEVTYRADINLSLGGN